ncbi:MAG: GH3 auxin-responsive promoter family protein [Acidimicrobiia bacterium]|nr:GH3 auxin-responsive promoter family protein [Acidimicrobiia bacterium]
MSGLGSRLFRGLGFWGGRVMLSRFEKTSARAVRANRNTLVKLLEANSGTEFGRKYRFAELAADPTGATYRAAVPLSTYDDYIEFVARMEAGEQDVLVADELLFFAVSSGTTGAPKLVPTTKKHHGFTFKYMGTVVQGVINRRLHRQGPSERGVDLMTFSGGQQMSSGGVPIGGATAEAVRRMARIVPHLWNSPIEVYTLADQPSAWYLHALYGLSNRRNQFVEAVFAPHLLEWLRAAEARWDELVDDIENGTLTKNLDIDDELRSQVMTLHRADPGRAAELRAAVAHGFDGFLSRVWPHMTHLMTITTGSFATYVPALQRYAGDLPIYSPSYGATESFIGVGLWPEHPERYVMATDPSYFEFIPVEHFGEAQPSTVDMEGIEIGRSYELVVTNHAGLYRYRLGDVVRVVDRFGEAPVIEFLYRRGTLLDLVGEKTSEDHVAFALSGLEGLVSPDELVDYTTRVDVDASPPRYVVYLELESGTVSNTELNRAADRFDQRLIDANPTCEGFRRNGLLGRPNLAVVAPGTFERLRTLIASGDLPTSASQLKVPRRVDDPRQVQLMSEAVIETV